MAAKKKATTKKAAPDILPTEFTIGGEMFRVTPKDEWTPRQDDAAMAVMMRISSKFKKEEVDGADELAIVDKLIASGLYRRMLGIALVPTDSERSIDENIEFFEDTKIEPGSFTAVMAVVSVFFGSGG